MNSAKATSNAIKNLRKWTRFGAAKAFARKMWAAYDRVRVEGTRLRDGSSPRISREYLNAMCMGFGDEHNVRMMKKYRDAAVAAERFCRR